MPRPHRSEIAVGVWARSFAFPGLYCPGLIEAKSSIPASAVYEGFPGLYCPGLIEATARRRPGRVVPGFPGLYCPGLIEAWEVAGASADAARCFRGSIAPASSKRAHE